MPVLNPDKLVNQIWGDGAPSGNVNTIPDADQTGTNPRGASFETGFPTSTLTPSSSGGLPPDGADMNGILNILTDHAKFQDIGGVPKFDATFATIIGGYDKGAVLQNNAGTGSYISAIDNNTINFNTTPASIGVQWLPYAGNSIAVGAPTYTEDDKWELCPVGHCQPYIENTVGISLTSWLVAHPNWRRLSALPFIDIAHTKSGGDLAGRSMAVDGNGHAQYTSAGSDNSSLISHSHVATDVVHSHGYKDRFHKESVDGYGGKNLGSGVHRETGPIGIGSNATDDDNTSYAYINAVTDTANLTINVSNTGSGNGVNANIQRTIYLPWIIKVA